MSVEEIVSDYRLDTYSKGLLRDIAARHGGLCPACWEIIDLVISGDLLMHDRLNEIEEELKHILDEHLERYEIKEIAEEAASDTIVDWVKNRDEASKELGRQIDHLAESMDKLVEYLSRKKNLNVRADNTTAEQIIKTLKVNLRKE